MRALSSTLRDAITAHVSVDRPRKIEKMGDSFHALRSRDPTSEAEETAGDVHTSTLCSSPDRSAA